MSIAALMGLVNVTGTLVLDSQGKLVVLPEGVDPRPGDVVLEQVAEQPSDELEGIKLAQVDVPSDDFGSSLLQGDQDALDIIAQIESGEDPTQNEDQATAAGDGLSSSISDAATVEAINHKFKLRASIDVRYVRLSIDRCTARTSDSRDTTYARSYVSSTCLRVHSA